MTDLFSHHLFLQVHQVVNLLFGVEKMGADAQVADAAQGAHGDLDGSHTASRGCAALEEGCVLVVVSRGVRDQSVAFVRVCGAGYPAADFL